MIRLKADLLPASPEQVQADLQEYLAARQAHAQTEGVPAPWPKYELLRFIAENGGAFEVETAALPAPQLEESTFVPIPTAAPPKPEDLVQAVEADPDVLRVQLLTALLQAELHRPDPLPVVVQFKASIEAKAIAAAQAAPQE